jgi:hypothetical protein
VAQRFTAAITTFQRWRSGLLKNSRFVSGYRFSDTANRSKSDAPSGAGRQNSSFSATCLALRLTAARAQFSASEVRQQTDFAIELGGSIHPGIKKATSRPFIASECCEKYQGSSKCRKNLA